MYPNLTSVIPSDFVDHLCDRLDCATKHTCHLGRVVVFGRDQRPNSALKDAVLLQIQPIKKVVDILPPHEILASQIELSDNEVVLVETDSLFIQPQQLLR